MSNKKFITDFRIMTRVILVLALIFLMIFIVANKEDPYKGEDKVQGLTPIARYVYGNYTIMEYYLKINIPSGISNIKNKVYLLVFEIEQEKNLNKSVLLFNNIFFYRTLGDLFHKATKTGNTEFNKKFRIYSNDPSMIKQIFSAGTSEDFLALVNQGLIKQPPIIASFATSENKIQLRSFRLRVTYDIQPSEFVETYNLPTEDGFRIVKLLVKMTASINHRNEPPENTNIEVRSLI